MRVLGDFQNTQAALLILRICRGVCRVNFLLRALPQPLVKDAADVFDDMMQETFASVSCAVFQIVSRPRLSCPRHPLLHEVAQHSACEAPRRSWPLDFEFSR
jgi:hypothetical protein